MSHRIEVKEGNVAEIYMDEATVPFIRQPRWPNGEEFATADAANLWATQFVEAIENQDAPFAQNGPDAERLAKPTPEQIAEMTAAMQNPPAPQA